MAATDTADEACGNAPDAPMRLRMQSARLTSRCCRPCAEVQHVGGRRFRARNPACKRRDRPRGPRSSLATAWRAPAAPLTPACRRRRRTHGGAPSLTARAQAPPMAQAAVEADAPHAIGGGAEAGDEGSNRTLAPIAMLGSATSPVHCKAPTADAERDDGEDGEGAPPARPRPPPPPLPQHTYTTLLSECSKAIHRSAAPSGQHLVESQPNVAKLGQVSVDAGPILADFPGQNWSSSAEVAPDLDTNAPHLCPSLG